MDDRKRLSEPSEDHSQEELPSAEPKTELRLVLVGGDSADNSHACALILRSKHGEEAVHSRKGNIRESIVAGRRVSVFKAPSYWMEHLASYWIFSNGVESIRHEIQNCTSTLFPGPHAFLLVMRAGHATGKEHYLLRAITSVFGAEALEYTMVMFIHGDEWGDPMDALKDRCVLMCGKRYHNLFDTDNSVERLFETVGAMVQIKRSKFFLQSSYENLMISSFEGWELRAKLEKEKLRKELEETKQTVQNLQKDSEDIERQHEKEMGACRLTERQLRKALDESKGQVSKLQREIEKYDNREKKLKLRLRDAETREEYARDLLQSEMLSQFKQKIERLMAKEEELELRESRLRGLEGQEQDSQACGSSEQARPGPRMREQSSGLLDDL